MNKIDHSKKVYLLMTALPDVLSIAAQKVMRYPYNHISLGFEEDMNTYYTFTYKGFTVEDITRRANKQGREPFPCELYELEVSHDVYHDLQERVRAFVENRNSYRYTKIGAALRVFLNIPTHRDRAYFCSQFVAEQLKLSGAARLERSAHYYLPPHFLKLKELKFKFRGNLLGYLKEYTPFKTGIQSI
jgi:hypothetical protein